MSEPAEKPQVRVSNIFSASFEDLGALVWREIGRNPPHKFFGRESMDELPDSLRERIPDDIGEAFSYGLETPYAKISFNNYFFPTSPLSVMQSFSAKLGYVARSLVQQLDAGCEEDNSAVVAFEFGRYQPSNDPYVHMSSKNLGISHDTGGFPRGETFTDAGNAMVTDLLTQKEGILSLPGLRDTDRELLRKTLGILEDQYKTKEIHIVGWGG
ncbi:hypothetical protein HN695_08085 [Candidatus Woesearchaeota archaeon]|nr:hypothetical protein [Candidatus Woesearchaeota archaeon]MBT5272500.1 hypothetical protein [Candidatus Woesearchaeota archaeon]MBT6041492.1 hypothetical protein [Candidatus Woesearchaeota archaeon]MBT6336362.1 hypothetical protein [Candidatus Woesearchaeota archaeon]MBT7928264.1 hypothetical protein [Candidatus Woesearchaeota archaeon]